MANADLESIVRGVLTVVDDTLPTDLEGTEGSVMLGVAAIRHGSNLLGGELDLVSADRWSLTRVLGRQITEAWLWANALFLDPTHAFDLLMLADAKQLFLREKGAKEIWEKLEKHRAGGIDLRNPSSVPPEGRQDLAALADDVHRLREASGLKGGIAVVSYQMHYRWESSRDVHVTFELLGRYLDIDKPGTVRSVPGPDDVESFRGPESLHRDTSLIADAVAVYLHATGQHERLTQLQQRILSLGVGGGTSLGSA